MPLCRYFIAGIKEDIRENNSLFNSPLPTNRFAENREKSLSTGFFLEAVEKFLKKNLEKLKEIYREEIKDIDIVLEKHGALYHPCRIIINQDKEKPLAINGALRKEAQKIMLKEIEALKKLKGKKIEAVPELFFSDLIELDNKESVFFFSAEWFKDFYEFHWSYREDKLLISIWEDKENYSYPDKEKTELLFKNISELLSLSYDFNSFEQIFPWHHAAGDFIVNSRNMDIRLISVRQYESLFLCEKDCDFSDKIEALLYFLWNMLLRMRLDRIDGIKEMVWAPDFIIAPAVSGFFKALEKKAEEQREIKILIEALPQIIIKKGRDSLFDMHREIIEGYNPLSEEVLFIEKRLKEHSELIYNTFLNL